MATKRLSIKITLNASDVFEKEIISFLEDKQNKAGHIKKLLYDRIQQFTNGVMPAASGPVTIAKGEPLQEKPEAPAIESKEINEKLSKMMNF